jgi:hypothetical protein
MTGSVALLMPLLNSVWQINNGSIAVVLVNITGQDIPINVKLSSIQNGYKEDLTSGSPLLQSCLCRVREQRNENLCEYICEGDSVNGLSLTVPAYACSVILIGSEKDYGVHTE